MRGWWLGFAFLVGVSGTVVGQVPAVQLVLDTSEADCALRILHKEEAKQTVSDAEWSELFATEPYRWLKEREAAIGAPFADEQFKSFLASPTALAKMHEWEQSLAAMKQANMQALGEGVLRWLPAGAMIHARVFAEIKPVKNSFVWKKPGGVPAIFLYLEKQSTAKFENTVAHESHHIGLGSLSKQIEAVQVGLPPNVVRAMEWMSAFGEGEAMLAAVGSSERHPHWEDDALARARWDGDMMHFNADLAAIQSLLNDILDGKLVSDAEIQKRAAPFWGDVQGAWYTVGYEMAALVEREYGREAFDECLIDPRKLLVRYNQIAEKANKAGAALAVWSPELLAKLQGGRELSRSVS